MKEIKQIELQLSNKDLEVRINALFDAYEYGEAGIKLIAQTIKDKTIKVRQAALVLLTESETETAKQALWNYLPFSKMQCLHTISEFDLDCYEPEKRHPSYLAISNYTNTLISHGDLGHYTCIHTWDLAIGNFKKSCRLQYAHLCRLGNNGKDIIFTYDDFITRISCEKLKDFGNKDITNIMNEGFNAYAVASRSPLISVGCTYGRFNIGELKIWSYINNNCYLNYSLSGMRLSTHHINTIHLWQRYIPPLFFTPDDKILIAHFVPNRLYSNIKLWNVQSGELIQTIENLPKLTITSVGVSLNGTIIACGIRENKISAWELQTDKIIFTTDEMCPCILSDNGRVLIYATASYEIVVRDLVKEQELCRLTGHNAPIAYLTLSEDYEFIASYSTDRQIKIWGIPDLS